MRFLNNNYTFRELTWPTASGITEDEATTRCREVLEDSPVNVLCESVTTVNKDELQAMCVVDIQVNCFALFCHPVHRFWV